MNIDVYPNFCKVYGTRSEYEWLRDLMSFKIPGAEYTKLFQRKQWDGKKKMFNIVNKAFPIGLLDFVLRSRNGRIINVIDHRKFPIFDQTVPELIGIELRDYQKKAILDCFKHKNCVIQAATNSGKTVVFAGIIKKMHPIPTLILIHNKEILQQIKDMVEGLTGRTVGVITANGHDIQPVTVAMIQTLVKRLGADQEITDFFESVQCVIVDECFAGEMKVLLADGSLVSLHTIYSEFLKGTSFTVKSYDFVSKLWVDRPVVRVFRKKSSDWVAVHFIGFSKRKVFCTSNHKWYLESGKTKAAAKLTPEDYIRVYPEMNKRFSFPPVLGDWQRQLVYGGIIGDLSIQETTSLARLRLVQGDKQKHYFDYKHKILKSLIRQDSKFFKTEFSPVTGVWSVGTVSSFDIKRILDEWVGDLPKFVAQLDARGWAFAFMDDGSANGHLYLNGFSEERAQIICDGYNRFFKTSAKLMYSKGWVMTQGHSDFAKFVSICGKFFHPSLRYKISKFLQTDEFIAGYCDAKDYAIVKVKEVVKSLGTKWAYNIEVASTHNYLISNTHFLVANCHHAKATSLQSLLSASKATYRFGFSGTVKDEGAYEGMMVRSWIGSVVFEITNDELISLGVSARPKVVMYEMDIAPLIFGVFDEAKEILTEKLGEFDGQQLMKQVYTLSVQHGIVHNVERNSKVLDILKENPGKSVLIVVDLLDHGREVRELLKSHNVDAEFISGTSEVRESALSKFKAGTLHVLISTNIIDEGVDISRIEVLVMLAGKKSRRQVLQRVGRSLRKKEGENVVHIYDFLDYGSKYLEKHSKERYKIYREEKFEIEIRGVTNASR